MTWTRRQFGLWSAAALVTQSALAEPPTKRQKQQVAGGPEPRRNDPEITMKDLRALELRLAFTSRSKGQVDFDVFGRNGGERGLGVWISTGEMVGAPEELMAWLDGQHPMSRRTGMPPYIDIPVGEEILLTRLSLGYGWHAQKQGPIVVPKSIRVLVNANKLDHAVVLEFPPNTDA